MDQYIDINFYCIDSSSNSKHKRLVFSQSHDRTCVDDSFMFLLMESSVQIDAINDRASAK